MGKLKVGKGYEGQEEVMKAETGNQQETKPKFSAKAVDNELKPTWQVEKEAMEKDGLSVKQETHKINLDTGKVRSERGYDPISAKDRMRKLSESQPKKQEEVVEEKIETPIESLSKEEIAESEAKEASRLQEEYKAEKAKLDEKFNNLSELKEVDKLYEVYKTKHGLSHEDAIWSIENLATVNDDDEYYRQAGKFTKAEIQRERLDQKIERDNILKEFDTTVSEYKKHLYEDLENKFKPKVKKSEPAEVKQAVPQEQAEEQPSDAEVPAGIQEQLEAMRKELQDLKQNTGQFGSIKEAKIEDGDSGKIRVNIEETDFRKGKRRSDYGLGAQWDVKPGTYKTAEQRAAESNSKDFGDASKWKVNKA